MVIAIGVIITALKWPFKSGFFSVVIGTIVLLMSLTNLSLNLFGKKEGGKEETGVDIKFSDNVDPQVAKQRTISIFLWISGFYFLILLVGFHIAVLIFFFFFLRFKGRENWRVSMGTAVLAWGAFYGLFVLVLRIPFHEGWIQKGLRAIGIG